MQRTPTVYYMGCNAIIYLYSTSSRNTMEIRKDHIGRDMESASQIFGNNNPFLYVVRLNVGGNEEVSSAEGEEIAHKCGAKFIEATVFEPNTCRHVLDVISEDLVDEFLK